MSINIRMPNITGATEEARLQQMQSYLHQLAEQLNWALNTINLGGNSETKTTTSSSNGAKDSLSTFNDIKGLIIKSADIVEAYSEAISKKLEGVYVAQSDFGVFAEQTTAELVANSKYIEQMYSNIQSIVADVSTLMEVNAHIKSGLLYYDEIGMPVYGLEIGQRSQVDGQEVFNKYARFTSEKLTFYDSNDNEVAYISDKKLFITDVEVSGSYRIGGFIDVVDVSTGEIITKWVGG